MDFEIPPWLSASRSDNGKPICDNFAAWFRESKVRDYEGDPIMMFHGTPSTFDAFDKEHLGSTSEHPSANLGFFFTTDPRVAEIWADENDVRILEVYLSIQNPLVMRGEHYKAMVDESRLYRDMHTDVDALLQVAAEAGHDGIRVMAIPGAEGEDAEWSAETWIAFHPDQIKARDNCGLFVQGNACMTDKDVQEKLLRAQKAADALEEGASAKPAP